VAAWLSWVVCCVWRAKKGWEEGVEPGAEAELDCVGLWCAPRTGKAESWWGAERTCVAWCVWRAKTAWEEGVEVGVEAELDCQVGVCERFSCKCRVDVANICL
jgi:hypothetical protein